MEKTPKLASTKPLFITLSCLSMGCLIGAFAAPLEQLEVWHQTERNQFHQSYTKVFVRTVNAQQKPYGFDERKAQKVAQIYDAATYQKLLLLSGAIIGSSLALYLGQETLEKAALDTEIASIENQGRKELILRKIRHKLAMASEAHKQLMREELRALVELAGGDDIQDASEINETDKFINANYLLMEGHDIDTVVSQTWGFQKGTPDHAHMTEKFQQWLEE